MSFFRRPHRKTRTGCVVCKQRRIKCDEARPACLRCKKRNLQCSYISSDTIPTTQSPSQISTPHNSNDKSKSLPGMYSSGSDIIDESQQQQQPQQPQRLFSPEIPTSSYVSPFNEIPDSTTSSSFPTPAPTSGIITDDSKLSELLMVNHNQNGSRVVPAIGSNQLGNSVLSPISQSQQPSNGQNLPSLKPPKLMYPSHTSTTVPITNSATNPFQPPLPPSNSQTNDSSNQQMHPSLLQNNNHTNGGGANGVPFPLYQYSSQPPSTNVSEVHSHLHPSGGSVSSTIDSRTGSADIRLMSIASGTTNTSISSNYGYTTGAILPNAYTSSSSSQSFNPERKSNLFGPLKPGELEDPNGDNYGSPGYLGTSKDKKYFVKPEFLSNKTYSEGLKQFGSPLFFEYIFYSEIDFKLTLYMMNTLPFRLCKDPANRVLFVTNLQVSALYDFLFHAFKAVTYMDLYYQQKMSGSDDVLNLNPKTYLQLGDYHLNRSLALMSNEVKVKEGIRKSIALIVTSTLQILYYSSNPNSSCSTRGFYELGESLGLLFADSAMAIVQNEVIRDACARYCINEWSLEPADYFPEFLYDIIDVTYNNDQESNLLEAKPLTQEQREVLTTIVDRLKKEYRSYANQTVRSNPISSSRFIPIESLLNNDKPPNENDSSRVFEYDMLGTLSRFIVDVPRPFIDLLGDEDPRALILSGYNCIALAMRKYEYWPNSVYVKEIDFIDSQLDKYQGSACWKSWLNVARTVAHNL